MKVVKGCIHVIKWRMGFSSLIVTHWQIQSTGPKSKHMRGCHHFQRCHTLPLFKAYNIYLQLKCTQVTGNNIEQRQRKAVIF